MNSRDIIGAQLKSARMASGLTVRQLSEMVGVTYQNINKIETGKYNVSIDILDKICSKLGIAIKIEKMKTLNELQDFINSHEDWELSVNDVISENGWTDETGEDYGICSDGINRLAFDSNMVAEIKPM